MVAVLRECCPYLPRIATGKLALLNPSTRPHKCNKHAPAARQISIWCWRLLVGICTPVTVYSNMPGTTQHVHYMVIILLSAVYWSV